MDRELEKIPGVIWNFSQPISDNMEEAVSGVKGQLAVKIYGDDLRTLEAKADETVAVMRNTRGIEDLGVFRVVGQPNLNFTVDAIRLLVMRSTSPTCRMQFRLRLVATPSPKC